jgi:hypothetical protein
VRCRTVYLTRKEPNVTPLTERTRGELVLDLLLGALRVGDPHLNALAVELLGRCCEGPVRRLVQEATNPRNRPAHRLRVLRAIRRIGPVTDLAAYLDLSVLGGPATETIDWWAEGSPLARTGVRWQRRCQAEDATADVGFFADGTVMAAGGGKRGPPGPFPTRCRVLGDRP